MHHRNGRPSFLRWLESLITFDQRDHPSHVAKPGRYPLVVHPIVRKKRLTKVLMDGGSGLNILYVDTLFSPFAPIFDSPRFLSERRVD